MFELTFLKNEDIFWTFEKRISSIHPLSVKRDLDNKNLMDSLTGKLSLRKRDFERLAPVPENPLKAVQDHSVYVAFHAGVDTGRIFYPIKFVEVSF